MKMTEKQILIELLSGKSLDTSEDVEHVAEYLLRSGVIVSPVQVGATVYYTDSYRHLIKPLEIFGFDCTKRICKYYCSGGDYTPAWFNPAEIGKTVFLTREEAEKALEEREENA